MTDEQKLNELYKLAVQLQCTCHNCRHIGYIRKISSVTWYCRKSNMLITTHLPCGKFKYKKEIFNLDHILGN